MRDGQRESESSVKSTDKQSPDPIPTPALKVAFDKALALLGLLLFSPLFLAVSIAMAVDGLLRPENRGPVFYKEERVTQGRIFLLYKFRVAKTAVIHAAEREKGHRHMKPLEKRQDTKTSVGRWLQKYYLDELPQLINILRGDMSFVGPRPWPVHMYEREMERGNYQKHLLRPGLTGYRQAHKGDAGRFGGSRAMDEAYIEALKSLPPLELLRFDLRILADSVRVVQRGEGL